MQVPSADSVCRFIRMKDWSTELEKPKARAFKQAPLSVWHEGRITEIGSTLEDLQFGEFVGSVQLSLTVADYLDVASQVSSCTGSPFDIEVVWRPEDEHVGEQWQQWRDAHAQVERVDSTERNFPRQFRNFLSILAQRKQATIPPDLDMGVS